MKPQISVIIPNWNGIEHLPTCLDSLRSQSFRDIEIILVDNASTDGSREAVAQKYPEVRLISLDQNLGFTGACNAGLRLVRSEVCVLLNNDTEADPSWLAELLAAFERHPEAGLVASRIMLFDRRDTFHAAGDLYRTNGTPGNRGVWERDRGQYDEEMPVFSASGGAAAYQRAMLDQIGLLDEGFFFSCEDVDLAWRAQLAGWKAIYAPRAVVYHKLAATGGGVTASFHDGRNLIYVLAKDLPGPLWRRHWREIIRAQLRITLEALKSWRGAAARARLRGQLAGLLSLPVMLRKRATIQQTRRVTIEYLESILTA